MLSSCYQMEPEDFPEWLNKQLAARGWSQADLVKRSGITSAQISRLISGTRDPGPEVCNSIARAFQLPPEEVFRAAKLLPPKPNTDATLEQANYKMAMLPEWQQKLVLSFIDTLIRQQEGVDENPSLPNVSNG